MESTKRYPSVETIRRIHTGVLFPGIIPIVSRILRSHQKYLELELFLANLFPPSQSLLERWDFPGEKKVPISDWLGELQTTPVKLPKSCVKPPFYLLALALLALAQRTNGERLWPNPKPPPTHYPSVCASATLSAVPNQRVWRGVEGEWAIKPSNSESAAVLTGDRSLPDRSHAVCVRQETR